MKKRLLHYWAMANYAGFEGGALALKAFLTVNTISTIQVFQLDPLSLKQGISVFIGGFLYHLMDYVTKNPFKLEDTDKQKEIVSN